MSGRPGARGNAPVRQGRGGLARHKKILRDNIHGVTKGDIRRLARRGGVKRTSGTIYEETRLVLEERLKELLEMIVRLVEYRAHKTVTVTDVIFVLNRLGKPIYGFGDPKR